MIALYKRPCIYDVGTFKNIGFSCFTLMYYLYYYVQCYYDQGDVATTTEMTQTVDGINRSSQFISGLLLSNIYCFENSIKIVINLNRSFFLGHPNVIMIREIIFLSSPFSELDCFLFHLKAYVLILYNPILFFDLEKNGYLQAFLQNLIKYSIYQDGETSWMQKYNLWDGSNMIPYYIIKVSGQVVFDPYIDLSCNTQFSCQNIVNS